MGDWIHDNIMVASEAIFLEAVLILECGVDLLAVAVDGLDVAELVVVLEVDVERDLEQLLQVLLARRRRRVLKWKGECCMNFKMLKMQSCFKWRISQRSNFTQLLINFKSPKT